MNTPQEHFRNLRQRYEKTAFLRGARKETNEYAKYMLDITYQLMDQLGWPDDEWHLESKSNRRKGYFHNGPRSSFGVMVAAKFLDINLDISICVDFADQGAHQLLIEDRVVGGFVGNNGKWTITDDLLDVVKDKLVQIALEVSEESKA